LVAKTRTERPQEPKRTGFSGHRQTNGDTHLPRRRFGRWRRHPVGRFIDKMADWYRRQWSLLWAASWFSHCTFTSCCPALVLSRWAFLV